MLGVGSGEFKHELRNRRRMEGVGVLSWGKSVEWIAEGK